MANLIQIKRSTTTAVPASLANGELAFSSNGNVLYIGANGAVEAISGKRFPGTLTANQALVANSTSGIDSVIVANLVPTAIYANGSVGTAGQTLLSNGSSVYWGTGTSGSNTQIQFNDSGVANGSAGFTFTKSSNNLFVGNTVTATNFSGNGASVTSVNAATVGGNTIGDIQTYADNKAANAYSNAMSDTLSRNGSYSGNNTLAGTNTVISSNLFVTGTINRSPTITLGGDLSGSITLTDLVGGTLTATIAANSVALGADTTGDYVANVTAGSGLSGSATGEGSTPTLAVVANNGLSSNSSGVFVVAGTGVTSNSTGVHIGQAVGTTDNVTFNDLTVNGNTAIGSNSSDIAAINARITTDINPNANVTYSLGTNTLRWNEVHAANVHSVDGYFDGNLQVSGNLVVLGEALTVNVSTLAVEDSLIQLATNNTTTDLLDIGFYGNYQVGGGGHEHTGLFRDASDDGIFKLFTGLQDAPTTTVDIAGTGYTQGTLQAYLKSNALISNVTHVAITANSTVNVAITANTLSLATALAATDGGTGFDTYNSGDILVANTGNALSKLALGTSGYVLQSNGTALVYDILDGGTF
jgi:cytoskeletal protein CcmA (bactofilin family)